MQSHYATLGLAPGASSDAIRKAFKKAILKAHPDKGGNNAEFVAIHEAYEALHDNTDTKSTEGKDDDEDLPGYQTQSDPVSESSGDSDNESEYEDGSEDGSTCDRDRDYGYGDLNETGGAYAVLLEDGMEVSLETHKKICGCDLGDGSSHRLISGEGHSSDEEEMTEDEGYDSE